MSYILDALKKAERERRPHRVPTLDSLHPTASRPRRRRWPWILSAALAANAALGAYLLFFGRSSEPSRTEGSLPAPATGERARAAASTPSTRTAALAPGSREQTPAETRPPAVMEPGAQAPARPRSPGGTEPASQALREARPAASPEPGRIERSPAPASTRSASGPVSGAATPNAVTPRLSASPQPTRDRSAPAAVSPPGAAMRAADPAPARADASRIPVGGGPADGPPPDPPAHVAAAPAPHVVPPAASSPSNPPAYPAAAPSPRVVPPVVGGVPPAMRAAPPGASAIPPVGGVGPGTRAAPPGVSVAPPTTTIVEPRPGPVKPVDQAPRAAAVTPPGLVSFRELPAAIRDSMPKLRLEVLAYSERRAERLVFISGQKYVEGGLVDGKVRVEEITQEGAILSHQGQRFLLKE